MGAREQTDSLKKLCPVSEELPWYAHRGRQKSASWQTYKEKTETKTVCAELSCVILKSATVQPLY